MNPLEQQRLQQQAAASPGLAAVLARARAKPVAKADRPASFRSWVEGSRAHIAELDSGVSRCGLERLYWREHRVGWGRVRLVYEVRGPSSRVAAFRRALDAWVSAMGGP